MNLTFDFLSFIFWCLNLILYFIYIISYDVRTLFVTLYLYIFWCLNPTVFYTVSQLMIFTLYSSMSISYLSISFICLTLLCPGVGLLAPPEVRQGKTSPELDTHTLVKQQIRQLFIWTDNKMFVLKEFLFYNTIHFILRSGRWKNQFFPNRLFCRNVNNEYTVYIIFGVISDGHFLYEANWLIPGSLCWTVTTGLCRGRPSSPWTPCWPWQSCRRFRYSTRLQYSTRLYNRDSITRFCFSDWP